MKKKLKKEVFEDHKLKSNIESSYDDPYGKRTDTLDLKAQSHAPSYGVIGKAGNSRVSQLISGLKSKKEMVILQEIIGLPKSLR